MSLPAAVYRPRNPQLYDYYHCAENYFETFVCLVFLHERSILLRLSFVNARRCHLRQDTAVTPPRDADVDGGAGRAPLAPVADVQNVQPGRQSVITKKSQNSNSKCGKSFAVGGRVHEGCLNKS